MKKNVVAGIVFSALCTAMTPALASDADLCLDCHEPAEDWQGLTAEEVFAIAKDADIKRHADNQELTDDQLKAIIAELLPE